MYILLQLIKFLSISKYILLIRFKSKVCFKKSSNKKVYCKNFQSIKFSLIKMEFNLQDHTSFYLIEVKSIFRREFLNAK